MATVAWAPPGVGHQPSQVWKDKPAAHSGRGSRPEGAGGQRAILKHTDRRKAATAQDRWECDSSEGQSQPPKPWLGHSWGGSEPAAGRKRPAGPGRRSPHPRMLRCDQRLRTALPCVHCFACSFQQSVPDITSSQFCAIRMAPEYDFIGCQAGMGPGFLRPGSTWAVPGCQATARNGSLCP